MQLFTSERGSIEIPFSRHPAIGAAQLLFRALEHSHCLYPLLSPASLSHRSNRYGQYRIASSFPSCISVAITLSGYLYVYHHLVYDHFRRNPWRAFAHSPPFPHHSPFPPPFTSVIRIAPAFLPLPVFNSLSTPSTRATFIRLYIVHHRRFSLFYCCIPLIRRDTGPIPMTPQ